MLNVLINNKSYESPSGIPIIEIVKYAGIYLPRFCYHSELSASGNCRMCLVELASSDKLVPACVTPVESNMSIFTESSYVQKARENVMRLLLNNHPLDCPVCDQGGECDLQEQAQMFGSGGSQFFFKKRGVENKMIHPLVKTIMTRCIQCSRCVRYVCEIEKNESLGMSNRGSATQITTYKEKSFINLISPETLTTFCPVGALTQNINRYASRPWEMSNIVMESFSNLDMKNSDNSVELTKRLKNSFLTFIAQEFNYQKDYNISVIANSLKFSAVNIKREIIDRVLSSETSLIHLEPVSFRIQYNLTNNVK